VKSYDENTDVGQSFDFISKLAQDWEKASKTSPEVRKIILRSGISSYCVDIFTKFVFSIFVSSQVLFWEETVV